MMTGSLNRFLPEIEAVVFDSKKAAAMIERACGEISRAYVKGCWEWAREHRRPKFEAAREAERLAQMAFAREDLPSLEKRLKEMTDGWNELIGEFAKS